MILRKQWYQETINIYSLHTVIWYQVVQSNTNNFKTSIWSIDWTLAGTNTPGQSDMRVIEMKVIKPWIKA